MCDEKVRCFGVRDLIELERDVCILTENKKKRYLRTTLLVLSSTLSLQKIFKTNKNCTSHDYKTCKHDGEKYKRETLIFNVPLVTISALDISLSLNSVFAQDLKISLFSPDLKIVYDFDSARIVCN